MFGRSTGAWVFVFLLLGGAAQSASAQDWPKVRAQSQDSVVFIETVRKRLDGTDSTPKTGTGFVISPRGHILTAAHVVPEKEAGWITEIYVTRRTVSRDKIPAQLIKADKDLDVAVLMVPASASWRPLCFGDSAEVQVESQLYKLGYAGGLELASDANRLTNLFGWKGNWQTNLALNRGDSGGPVFDASGRVVGIASSGFEQAQLITFVIPESFARTLRQTVGALSPSQCLPANREPASTERPTQPVVGRARWVQQVALQSIPPWINCSCVSWSMPPRPMTGPYPPGSIMRIGNACPSQVVALVQRDDQYLNPLPPPFVPAPGRLFVVQSLPPNQQIEVDISGQLGGVGNIDMCPQGFASLRQ